MEEAAVAVGDQTPEAMLGHWRRLLGAVAECLPVAERVGRLIGYAWARQEER